VLFTLDRRRNVCRFSEYHCTQARSFVAVSEDLERALADVDTIDILINNAGYIVVKPFAELSHEEIQTAYQVNVIGVMQTIQSCLPKLQKGSHIVNISSMGGFQGSAKFAGLSAYSTSKAAVASLTELLAEELKETGIQINCLCLGSVQTEMLETAFPGYKAPLQPEEMAAFICNFAETAHRYMHGRIIPVSLTTP
jgi:3-oxoacyl-[acyl-carrier protein] reductase